MRSPEEALLDSKEEDRRLFRLHNGRRFAGALGQDAFRPILFNTPKGIEETQGFIVPFSGEVTDPSGEISQTVAGEAMLEEAGTISVITKSYNSEDQVERIKQDPSALEDPFIITAFAEDPLIKSALAIREMREDMTRRAEHVRRDKIKKAAERLARGTTDRIIGSVPPGGVVHLYPRPEAQTA